MQLPKLSHSHIHTVTRALRLKIKTESYAWLNAAAYEVNQVWNWAAEVSEKAARPCTGERKWLTGFDLNNLSSVPLSTSTKSVPIRSNGWARSTPRSAALLNDTD